MPKTERPNLSFAMFALLALLFLTFSSAYAATQVAPGISIDVTPSPKGGDMAAPLKILLGLTLLSLLPAMLIAMTSFSRIIIVLSLLRHALGTQETPPNTVLLSLALFLTLFSMSPVLSQLDKAVWQPYQAGQINEQQALAKAEEPLRDFMLRQTREQDLALMVEISKADTPTSVDEVRLVHLIPAFMLSELRSAFQIGFVIFLPFLLIDLIVSSILMALGMMMVPPVMVSLPLKILMFVVIDGWSLVVKALVSSIH
jgi:flagellar biosynthesis protein FliP